MVCQRNVGGALDVGIEAYLSIVSMLYKKFWWGSRTQELTGVELAKSIHIAAVFEYDGVFTVD